MLFKSSDNLLPVVVLAIAAAVYGLYGFEGPLGRDEAVAMYSGQRMAEGVPPYVSSFDRRAPLTHLLPGLGVILSRLLGTDDLYTVRVVFLAFGALAVVAVYLLGHHLFGSARIGFFSSLVFLGFYPFAQRAAWGPQPKVPMVLFMVLSLLLTSQRRWFWAGFFGSLAALTWQPMAVFPLVILILAAALPREERFAGIIRTLAGTGLPVLLVLAYFQYYGAVPKLWEAAVIFNLFYAERPEQSIATRILDPLQSVFVSYKTMAFPILVGILMVFYIYSWRRSLYGSVRETLLHDKFAVIFSTLPFPVAWSLFDFQGPPDFFVFLPYIAIGFGCFLQLAIQQTGVGAMRFLSSALGVALMVIAVWPGLFYRKEVTLNDQKEAALEIEWRFGEDVRLVSIGVPEILVLLHRVNPDRYAFVQNGIHRLIEATYPGGVAGWIKNLEEYAPQVVAYGPTRGIRGTVQNWLKTYYHQDQIGPFRLWIRNDIEEHSNLTAVGIAEGSIGG